MTNLKKIVLICFSTVLISCYSISSYASTQLPQKVDPDDAKITVTDKEDQTSQPTSKTTSKATAKATTKATEKSTSTSKATAKATQKSTQKASSTSKTSSSDSSDPQSTDKIVLSNNEDDVLIVETTPEAMLNVDNNGQNLSEKHYLTNGGAFLWFLLTVLVSAVISFAISYRFYKMGKKDNHLQSELRALKRDIDSKMVGSVSGFSEYDLKVNNSNKSYRRSNSSIKSNEKPLNEEENKEMLKKWENQIKAPASENNNSSNEKTEFVSHRNQRPLSRSNAKPKKTNKVNGVTNKIKGVINDIFPFEK